MGFTARARGSWRCFGKGIHEPPPGGEQRALARDKGERGMNGIWRRGKGPLRIRLLLCGPRPGYPDAAWDGLRSRPRLRESRRPPAWGGWLRGEEGAGRRRRFARRKREARFSYAPGLFARRVYAPRLNNPSWTRRRIHAAKAILLKTGRAEHERPLFRCFFVCCGRFGIC